MTEGTAAQTSGTKVTWLTQEAYDRLQAELEHLSGPARTEITERIAAARAEGDLKENGGYHAAKDEQVVHLQKTVRTTSRPVTGLVQDCVRT